MDTLLILLGVIGFGAIIISVHVFFVDSVTYQGDSDDSEAGRGLRERNGGDRRSGLDVIFPLLINGMVVAEDRRSLPDRRGAAG